MEINENTFKDNVVINRSINDYLMSGEKVLWHEKPNSKSYVSSKVLSLTPFAIIWLIIDSLIIFGILATGTISKMPFFVIIFLLVFFAIHLMPVWMWVGQMIKANKVIKYAEYYITNMRVIITNFPNEITINQVNIKDITNVTMSRKGMDKLFKVGDITIFAGKKTITLYDIKEPVKIYSIFERIKTDFENLKNLPTYKICDYCGNQLDDNDNKCQSCGAKYNEKI